MNPNLIYLAAAAILAAALLVAVLIPNAYSDPGRGISYCPYIAAVVRR